MWMVCDLQRQLAEPVHGGRRKPERDGRVREYLSIEGRAGAKREDVRLLPERVVLVYREQTLKKLEQHREVVMWQVGIGDRDLPVRGGLTNAGHGLSHHVDRRSAVGR